MFAGAGPPHQDVAVCIAVAVSVTVADGTVMYSVTRSVAEAVSETVSVVVTLLAWRLQAALTTLGEMVASVSGVSTPLLRHCFLVTVVKALVVNVAVTTPEGSKAVTGRVVVTVCEMVTVGAA